MAAPPPKPKKGPDDLAEVERALSVLKGRHPEHERARREDEESRKQRAAAVETIAEAQTRIAHARRIRILAIGAPIVLLFAFIGVFGRREMARRARIDAVSDAFRVHGFAAVETSLRGSTGAVDTTAEPGCWLAVSTDTRPMTVTRAGATVSVAAPALFCTCASERIALASPVGAEGGIALLRADAALVGGTRAFAYAPFKPASTLVFDDPCSEASFAAWIEAKRYPHPPFNDAWLTAVPARATLAAAGFQVVGIGRADAPPLIVEVPKESCIIATGAGAEDRLALREKADSAAVAEGRGALGRCGQTETTLVVSREGSFDVTVLAAPAAKVGGLVGLRELTARAGLALSATAAPPGDRGWDAKLLLVASAIPEATVTTGIAPDVAPEPEARIVALSLETPNALTPEPAPGVASFCVPPLGPSTREAVCLFSGPQKWRSPVGNEAPAGGLARSKLPAWLFSMNGVKDPLALEGITKLLGLARVLGRQGFAPSTLEALVEQPNAVDILGRTGEDAVVAVGVAPSEPWVYTLTEDAAWELDEAPPITMVKPLEKVTLIAPQKKLPPMTMRRTVVFRRRAP